MAGRRSGNTAALDASLSHDRISAGTLPGLLEHAAWRSVQEAAAGRSVAVTAKTNEDVAVLNRAIQRHRCAGGDLGEHTVRIAGGATAAVGDIVVTRRNARDLLTDRGEPVRNRDGWVVTAVGRDGTLTVSHLRGHGTVTPPR